jgi:hypothetical protein
MGAEELYGEQATKRGLFRALVLVSALLLLAACGQPMTPSPGAEPERTLPPTVGIELSPGTVVSRPTTLDSPEEAQELVSFPVLVPDPGSLPAGLALEAVGWQPYPEKDTELVALSYQDAENTTDLHIQQIALGEKGMGAPRQPHEEIPVRDTTGYALSSAHAEGQGPVALAWEENGQAVTVSASGLTLEQTLRIVEGMEPVGR